MRIGSRYEQRRALTRLAYWLSAPTAAFTVVAVIADLVIMAAHVAGLRLPHRGVLTALGMVVDFYVLYVLVVHQRPL